MLDMIMAVDRVKKAVLAAVTYEEFIVDNENGTEKKEYVDLHKGIRDALKVILEGLG